MAGWALAFFLLFLVLAFGLRSAIQWRRTGATGFRGISGRPGSPEWLGGVLFVVALLAGLAGAAARSGRRSRPVSALDGDYGHSAGVGLFAGGLMTTVWSQFAMGDSWRIGVDAGERTELVTGGPFSIVRNPIFSGVLVASAGLVLLVPNVVALAGFALLAIAIELQVRLVEEPYLKRAHGAAFAEYAARVGRFLPGLGRL